MDVFFGVDCDTQSLKVGAFSVDGYCLAAAREELHDKNISDHVCWQAADHWWKALGSCCRRVMGDVDSRGVVRGIGVCATCSRLVGVDPDWMPVTRAILWCDQRAAQHAARLTEGLRRAGIRRVVRSDELISRLLWGAVVGGRHRDRCSQHKRVCGFGPRGNPHTRRSA